MDNYRKQVFKSINQSLNKILLISRLNDREYQSKESRKFLDARFLYVFLVMRNSHFYTVKWNTKLKRVLEALAHFSLIQSNVPKKPYIFHDKIKYHLTKIGRQYVNTIAPNKNTHNAIRHSKINSMYTFLIWMFMILMSAMLVIFILIEMKLSFSKSLLLTGAQSGTLCVTFATLLILCNIFRKIYRLLTLVNYLKKSTMSERFFIKFIEEHRLWNNNLNYMLDLELLDRAIFHGRLMQ